MKAKQYSKGEIKMGKINEEDLAIVNEVIIFGEPFNVYGTLDDPKFLAVDIAEMIEYSVDKTHQMLELVDDDEKLTDTIYRAGQKRGMVCN